MCSGGACAAWCTGDTTECGGLCVDTANDPLNCGACNAACSSGQICVGGVCAACPPGKPLCQGACVTTAVDATNCGSCGHACSYVILGTAVCSAGVCTPQCNAGRADCDADPSYCETTLASSASNCGACGVVCPAGKYCSAGACTSCGPGTTYCGNGYGCIDTSTSVANCGACGNYCPHAGSNTQSMCADGMCGGTCYPGYVDCDGDSTNGCEIGITSDPKNCGTCGLTCAAGQVCSSGLCTSCPAGQTVCGNACVNLASSSANCGSCGVACLTFAPHASASCAASRCALACSTGDLDCDGNGLTGCEAPLGPSNCGGCGVVCGATAFCAKPFACATCGATDLGNSVPQTVTGTTIGKADQFDSFCGFGNAPDVRYQLTAPAAATYTFDTLGSAFNTVLVVRDGGCAGPRLGCNDDSGGAFTSKVSLPLTQGQIVTIFIDGRQGSQGSYTLHVK